MFGIVYLISTLHETETRKCTYAKGILLPKLNRFYEKNLITKFRAVSFQGIRINSDTKHDMSTSRFLTSWFSNIDREGEILLDHGIYNDLYGILLIEGNDSRLLNLCKTSLLTFHKNLRIFLVYYLRGSSYVIADDQELQFTAG